MIEDILGDQFKVERPLPALSTGAQRFLIRSRQSGNSRFSLSVIEHAQPVSDAALRKQRAMAELMSRPPVEELCGVLSSRFRASSQFTISAYAGEQTLDKVLRRRHALPFEEVDQLLYSLVRAIEASTQAGWPWLLIDPTVLCIEEARNLIKIPAPDIPSFDGNERRELPADLHETVTFNLHAFAPEAPAPVPESSRDYVFALAALVCEMLGQPQMIGGSRNVRFQPVPQLSSEQNQLLRRSMVKGARQPFESAQAFFEALSGARFASAAPGSIEALAPVADEPLSTETKTGASTNDVAEREPEGSPFPALPACYRLQRELASTDYTRFCKIEDAEGRALLMTMLSRVASRRLDVSVVEARLKLLQRHPSPFIVPVVDAQIGEVTYVVRALPSNRNLANALKDLNAYPASDARALLGAIYFAYRALWDVLGVRLLVISLNQIWLDEASGEGGGTGRLQVALDAGDMLLRSTLAGSEAQICWHFATLTYQLLGTVPAAIGRPMPAKYSPVAEFTSEENEWLKLLCEAEPEGSSHTSLAFVDSVMKRLAGEGAARAGGLAFASVAEMRVPEPFSKRRPVSASRFRLKPVNPESPMIGLSAAGEFLVGRSSAEADFVAQFRPRSSLNDGRTRKLSRVHLRFGRRGGDVLRVTESSTANASLIGDEVVGGSRDVGLPLRVLVGGEYELRVEFVPSHYGNERRVAFAGARGGGWDDFCDTLGATCVVSAGGEGVLPMMAAWIESDVAFTADSGRLRLGVGPEEKPVGRFHWYRSIYWVEATQEEIPVVVEGVTLGEHEMAALEDGQQLVLGEHEFKLEALPSPSA